MSEENPEPTVPPVLESDRPIATPPEVIISDVVTGLNLRKSDNVIQGISIGVGSLLGAIGCGIWGFVVERKLNGNVGAYCLAGLVGGMIVSLVISGAVLGVYRLFKH